MGFMGFIGVDVLWGFNYVDGCDLHKRKLITSCPYCKTTLTRFRGGLLQCRCKQDLSEVRGDLIESEVEIEFLQMMRLKIYGKSIKKNSFRKKGFPVDYINNMSVSTLCWLIQNFPDCSDNTCDIEDRYSISKTNRAACIFSNWPNGFFGYLSGMGKRLVLQGAESTSFRTQFIKVYTFLRSSSITSEDVKFIYEAFIQFGTSHWKTALVDKRMCKEYAVERKIVGLNDLAKRMRVQPSTVRRMIELGIVRVEKKKGHKRPTYLFDLSYKLPFKNGKGSGILARDSAKYVELPISVLNQLRSDGVFTVNYISDKLKSYHIMDLDRFIDLVLNNIKSVDMSSFDSEIHVFLKDVMRMNMGGAFIKAKLVTCIIDRSIFVEGVIDSSIAHIILLREEVTVRVKKLKEMRLNSLLVSDAAKTLSCDPTAIPDLVARGYLDSRICSNGIRITENSLRDFMAEYTSCRWVASQLKTSSRKIISLAKQKDINFLNIKRSHSKSYQPFVKRESLAGFGIYE